MKPLVTFACVGLFLAMAPQAWSQAAGDVGSVKCRQVQLEAQTAVLTGGPYKTHGQLVSTAADVVSAAEDAGEITEACAACIMDQFARRIPIEEQTACGSFCPSQEAQATLVFELEGFDLETGAILSEDDPGSFPPAVDFHFVFNGVRANPIVLLQNQFNGTEIAFLDGTPFDTVECSVVGTLTFTTSFIDVPFDFDDTVVIRTAGGNVFKLGKPVNNGNVSVTFSYAELQ
jgi:hypothetical protein